MKLTLASQSSKSALPFSVWGAYSVWRRHASVYLSTWRVNFLPPISEPLFYLLAFGLGLSPIVKDFTYLGQEVSYLKFLAPGTIALGVLFQSFFEGAYGSFIRLNFQRTWQALLTAPLTFTDVFMGDWLWAMTRGAIAGVVTSLVTVVFGLYPWWGMVVTLPVIVACGLLFGALGLYTAGIVRTIDQINVPVFLLLIPMFTLSGVYFPRETLPTALDWIATVMPLAGAIDLIRWPMGLPVWWPLQLLWLLGLTAIAAWLAWRQIHRKLFG